MISVVHTDAVLRVCIGWWAMDSNYVVRMTNALSATFDFSSSNVQPCYIYFPIAFTLTRATHGLTRPGYSNTSPITVFLSDDSHSW